jgi:hypothetical protein
MTYKIKQITEDDVPEVSRWFESISWDMPPIEGSLPPAGYLALKDNKPVACAFAYLTGTSISFVQWTNTNPDVSDKEQSEGLSFVIETVKEIVSSLQPQVKSIVIMTKNEKFATKLKTLGFRTTFGFYQCSWVLKNDKAKSKKD